MIFEFFKNLFKKMSNCGCSCSRGEGCTKKEQQHKKQETATKKFSIFAPMSGEAIEIEKTSDDAFAQKLLGRGVTIVPESGEVVSPVDGEVIHVFETLHAYGLRDEGGAEILIHIGINTVELKGEGFEAFVTVGQKVKVGDKIASVNLEFLESKGYCTHTPIVITNGGAVKDVSFKVGSVRAGESEVISYCQKS